MVSQEERRLFKGVNIMTPKIEKFGECPDSDFIYEFSSGRGFRNQKIFGVTVVNRHTGEKPRELCDCFDSRQEAMNHINSIA